MTYEQIITELHNVEELEIYPNSWGLFEYNSIYFECPKITVYCDVSGFVKRFKDVTPCNTQDSAYRNNQIAETVVSCVEVYNDDENEEVEISTEGLKKIANYINLNLLNPVL